MTKYGAKKTMLNGVHFDSRAEATRWSLLLLDQAAGKITHLERQVPFKLYGRGGTEICKLVVDYVYFENGKRVCEDSKGVRTKDFRLKQKLFEDNYPGVELRLTGAWQKIEDRQRSKARAKYAQKKMLMAMVAEK